MPALVLFGRRWQVGTDDFVISSIVDLIVRLIWLIAGVGILWKNEQSLHCAGGYYIRIFYYGFFTIAHCLILLDILLLVNSRKGSIILDSNKRKYVPSILYLRLGTEAIEVTWSVLGTVGLYKNTFHCITAPEPIQLIEYLIIFNWIVLTFQLLYFLYLFDPLGNSDRPFEAIVESSPSLKLFGVDMPLAKTKYTKKWQRRCRCVLCSWCCVNDDGVLDSYREVAKMFGAMFAEDLVTSDVLAGLVLLSLKHKEKKAQTEEQATMQIRTVSKPVITREFSGTGITTNSISQHTTVDEEWKSVKFVNNYVRFACGAYGFVHPIISRKNPMKLLKNCSCCSCLPGKKRPTEVEGDSCCFCCLSGVKTSLVDIPFDDIIYASFKDSTFRKPFFIALDHKFKSIVIACRGTLSFKDVLTDMTGWPAHIPEYPESFKAHHGMLLSCLRLKQKLNNLKIIDELLSKYPNYEIVLTGQSLGAGMATILSLLLQPQYPQLKCYVYSPPGGLLSLDAAEYCKNHIVAVIYGDDLISRLGILQFERLKINLMTALRECKTPKYRLLLGAYCCLVHSPKLEYISNNNVSTEDIRFTSVTVDDSTAQDAKDIQTGNIFSSRNNSLHCDNTKMQQMPDGSKFPTVQGMYPPGNIFYVTKLPKSERRLLEPKWIWRWAERHEFDDIIVSTKMILDHIPVTMPNALLSLANPVN